jgi:hypothetical protein
MQGGYTSSDFNKQCDSKFTKHDLKCLRVKSRPSANKSFYTARKVDKKGRYMRDIMKHSACFENYFTMTEQSSASAVSHARQSEPTVQGEEGKAQLTGDDAYDEQELDNEEATE